MPPVPHVVTPQESGWRLDRVVASLPDVGSRRRAREAIDSGKVDVDGVTAGPTDAGRPLPAGTRVEVSWSRPGTSHARASAERGLLEAGLVLLHQDRDLVVVDKPPGLLTDTASREQSMERDSVVQRLRPWLRAQGDSVHVVHRIDRDTSGVVLLARNTAAEEDLLGQFREHGPERVYRAFVLGIPEPQSGSWEDWMTWDRKGLLQRPCRSDAEGALLARASYQVVRTFQDRFAELEVRLVTGRRNQIRVHLQLRGHPLLGEKLYLPRRWKDPEVPLRRQALHAARLGIRHPRTGESVAFESPLPADLERLVAWMDR